MIKHRKKRVIILVVILLVVASACWVFRNPMPKDPAQIKDYFDKEMASVYIHHIPCYHYKVPSWAELEELNKSVSPERKYPAKIKGIFDPGPGANTIDLLYFSDEIKDIGTNTYYVAGEYELKEGQLKPFHPVCREFWGFAVPWPIFLSEDEIDRVLIQRILLAKKEGFSVVLIPDYPNVFSVGRDNFNTDSLDPQFEDIAIKYAKIAEEYHVEYLVPINEYNFLLYSNGYTFEEINQKTNAFYERLTPKLREIYTGKIVYKYGMTQDKNMTEGEIKSDDYMEVYGNMRGLSTKGADLFFLDCDFGLLEPERGLGTSMGDEAQVKAAVGLGQEISPRDQVPGMIGEFMVFTPLDRKILLEKGLFGAQDLPKTPSTIPQEEYYRWSIDYLKANSRNERGFTFTGFMGVRRNHSIQIIKEYFDSFDKK